MEFFKETKSLNFIRIISLFLCVLTVISVIGISVTDTKAAENETVLKQNTDEYAKTDNNPATSDTVFGWTKRENKWSYIGKDGALYKSGLYSIGDKKYLFDNNGYIRSGFREYKNKTYYFSESGSSPEKGLGARKNYKGWKKIKSDIYYFKNDYSVTEGWKNVSGKMYYFSEKGKLYTGWKKIGKNTFFFKKDGAVAKKGVMQTGWKKIGKKTFYFKKQGKTGNKGSLFTGLKKIGKNSFYFSPKGSFGKKGALKTGWKKVGKYTYFFKTSGKIGKKGKMLKNQIAGSKKRGYGYVDKNGKKIKTKAIDLAVKYVNKHTKKSQSKSKKLKACFDYLWKNYKYKRFYGFPKKTTLTKKYAEFMLKTKKGNCFCYGATFACIARVLGYESRVGVGSIEAVGGGMTPHGWAEIKRNGKWYMADPDMQMNIPSVNVYLKTKSNYPYDFRCKNHYKIKFKKAELVWEKTA